MDNAQKAIMIGVGLFITLLIIAAVMALVNLATGLIGEGTNKVISLNDALVNSLYRDYDDVDVKGAQVIAAADQYYKDMIIEVQATSGGNILELGVAKGNGTNTIDKPIQYAGDESATKVSSLRSSSSENYVPNSATYHAELIKTQSGDAVLGILFRRK